MLADRGGDVIRALRDRQLRRQGDRGAACRPCLAPRNRALDGVGDPLPLHRRRPAVRARSIRLVSGIASAAILGETREQAGRRRGRGHP